MPSQRRQVLCGSVSEKDSAAVGCLRAYVLGELRVGAGVESDFDGGECVSTHKECHWKLSIS